ncbi:hypothetical protein D3C87_1757880 [compost metagenome]
MEVALGNFLQAPGKLLDIIHFALGQPIEEEDEGGNGCHQGKRAGASFVGYAGLRNAAYNQISRLILEIDGVKAGVFLNGRAGEAPFHRFGDDAVDVHLGFGGVGRFEEDLSFQVR